MIRTKRFIIGVLVIVAATLAGTIAHASLPGVGFPKPPPVVTPLPTGIPAFCGGLSGVPLVGKKIPPTCVQLP